MKIWEGKPYEWNYHNRSQNGYDCAFRILFITSIAYWNTASKRMREDLEKECE